ncbi:MAG: hypothetical protein H0X38_03955 [Planctomycetes bacterium]|nr:hypothetical protein [Planctomycetota bacterium]
MRLFTPVLLSVLSAALALAAETSPTAPTIPAVAVVQDWAELLAQPVIDLGGGVRMRLGLEAACCASGSGVLLYCLTEGFTPLAAGNGEDWLGPARTTLVVDGVRTLRDRSVWLREIGHDQQRHPGLPLYARMIAIPKPGTYVVGIEIAHAHDNERGPTLATATIAGTGEAAHPWGNLGASARIDEALAQPQDEILAPAIAIACGFTGMLRAIPAWDEHQPLAHLPDTTRHLEHRPLPTLLPTTPDPRLTLSWHGGFLVVDSQVAMTICAGCPPFLVRCWINDQPFHPAIGAGKLQGGICHQNVHRVALHCEFDAAALKAKSGDRLGIQILYCVGGWNWSGESLQHLAQPVTLDTEPDLPPVLLSNRLDITIP